MQAIVQIQFSTVSDARFPGRFILIGQIGDVQHMASFVGRREKAEQAIRDAFAQVRSERGLTAVG